LYFALVYYPQVGVENIDAFRRRYDPTASVIEAHMAVMFPVPASVGLQFLVEHIETALRAWSPFSIHLKGFSKSHDHWLFLTVDKGRAEVIELFEQIYTGRIAEYRRHDIDFNPHVGLGLFIREDVRYDMSSGGVQREDLDEPRYREALREARSLNLDFESRVDKLDLVELPAEILDWAFGKRAHPPDDERVVTRREFTLQGEVR